MIGAQDGAETIAAWIEVEPPAEAAAEHEGCRIVLRSWQASALPVDDSRGLLERRASLDREVAELTARLDAEQRIITVDSDSPELQALAAAMAEGGGRPFTAFVSPEGHGNQALHWRMLDGAPVSVPGSSRDWRIVLLPLARPGAEPVGFELLLVSDQPPPVATAPPLDTPRRASPDTVGADLAPVLRQPISRIVANAETIRSRLAGPLPDAYADYAAEIANAGRLLLGLLNDLADLEIVEADGFVTSPDRIDLAEVSRQAAGILGVRAQEKDIAVQVPPLSENFPVVAEFRRVLQVLINLLGNAIRYAPEGSMVQVRLEREHDRARVIVADQGPGLSPDDQAIVFEKFERLGRTGDGGSGLGLYISRRLARAMGGELWVESTLGEGACFILEVPADVSLGAS
jgi:signal transduction histidine kinase